MNLNLPALEIRHWVLLVFVASALYVHLRGRDRFELKRALDFTVLLAPVNALMLLFSRAPRGAFIDPTEFSELAVLRAHWQEIRDEALRLNEDGAIRAATGYNDIGFNSFFRAGWARFYLCWYGREMPSARQSCPRTLALLNKITFGEGGDVCVAAAGRASGAPPRPLRRLAALPPRPDHAQRPGLPHRRRRPALPLAGRRSGDNRFFHCAYRARLVAKQLKARQRRLYYAGKWLLIGGLSWALFW